MKKVSFKCTVTTLVVGGFMLSSCEKFDLSNYDYKKDVYAENWEETFGQIDANQDWSMAAAVTATANLKGAASGSSLMSIYTQNPIHKSARLLATAELTDGDGGVSFDALKGMDKVFVTVNHEGKDVVYGYFPIKHGAVNVGTTRRQAMTRAADGIKVLDNPVYYNGDEGKDINCELNFKAILGAERMAAKPWILSWGYELFGMDGAFFKESQQYYNSEKTKLPGYDVAKIEQGFTITTTKENSEISLPAIYSCTGGHNELGYVYYKDGEDPLEKPHYIIMNDATTQSNIFYNKWYSSFAEAQAEGNAMENWDDLGKWNDASKSLADRDPETEIYGTEYKLVFFGDNHDQPASYQFPEGYHIVFFILPVVDVNETANDRPHTHMKPAQFAYSDPALNKAIGHTREWNKTVADSWDHPSPEPSDEGAVKATAWKYNDCTFLGFEDFFDDDLNDLVILVEGDFTPENEIIEVPSTTKPSTERQTWLIACEDLGSTNDYDFNDIVIEVVKTDNYEEEWKGEEFIGQTYKNSTVQLRVVAAGGTLPANISYNGKEIGESHALLGVPTTSMANTGKGQRVNPSEYITIEENVGLNWTLSKNIDKFKIEVEGNDGASELITAPTKGTAPQILLLPGEWRWPLEQHRIEVAYPSFADWSSDANNTDWINEVVDGEVFKLPQAK